MTEPSPSYDDPYYGRVKEANEGDTVSLQCFDENTPGRVDRVSRKLKFLQSSYFITAKNRQFLTTDGMGKRI